MDNNNNNDIKTLSKGEEIQGMEVNENENKTGMEINSENKEITVDNIKKENIVGDIDKNSNNNIDESNNSNEKKKENNIEVSEDKKESIIKDINDKAQIDNSNNTFAENLNLNNSKAGNQNFISNSSTENINKEQTKDLKNLLSESKNNLPTDNETNLQSINTNENQNVNINNSINTVQTKKEEKRVLKKSHVHLKRSTISTMQPLIIRKGASSNYLKGNVSYLNEGNDVSLDPEKNYSDVIVIHPGSRYLRIGRASDAFPKEIPNCIARDVTPLVINTQKEKQMISEKKREFK